jgi:hypothetical protein
MLRYGTYRNLDSDSYPDFAPTERDPVFRISCKQRVLCDLSVLVKFRRPDHLSRKFSV